MKNFDINSLWKKENLPIINGVLFPNGEIICFSIQEGVERKIIETGKSTIDIENMPLANIDIACHLELPDGYISCGEGSMGGDGFLCLEKKNSVEWVVFFENSNPFTNVIVNDSVFIAENNLLEAWEFSINGPSDTHIKISKTAIEPNKKRGPRI